MRLPSFLPFFLFEVSNETLSGKKTSNKITFVIDTMHFQPTFRIFEIEFFRISFYSVIFDVYALKLHLKYNPYPKENGHCEASDLFYNMNVICSLPTRVELILSRARDLYLYQSNEHFSFLRFSFSRIKNSFIVA